GPIIADEIDAHLVWFGEDGMLPGRRYVLKIGGRKTGAVVSRLAHQMNIASMERQAATDLGMNGIGAVTINLDAPLVCDPYRDNRETGGFILVDVFTNQTVGAGVIDAARRRAADIQWQDLIVDVGLRAKLKLQRPVVLWFTGLVGSGRSTVANV